MKYATISAWLVIMWSNINWIARVYKRKFITLSSRLNIDYKNHLRPPLKNWATMTPMMTATIMNTSKEENKAQVLSTNK